MLHLISSGGKGKEREREKEEEKEWGKAYLAIAPDSCHLIRFCSVAKEKGEKKGGKGKGGGEEEERALGLGVRAFVTLRSLRPPQGGGRGKGGGKEVGARRRERVVCEREECLYLVDYSSRLLLRGKGGERGKSEKEVEYLMASCRSAKVLAGNRTFNF